jgi:hypothetical protein
MSACDVSVSSRVYMAIGITAEADADVVAALVATAIGSLNDVTQVVISKHESALAVGDIALTMHLKSIAPSATLVTLEYESDPARDQAFRIRTAMLETFSKAGVGVRK